MQILLILFSRLWQCLLQDLFIQSFWEVMGALLLAEANIFGQCNIPPVKEGMCYTQVSAGGGHSVLLRSDGNAVACGMNGGG